MEKMLLVNKWKASNKSNNYNYKIELEKWAVLWAMFVSIGILKHNFGVVHLLRLDVDLRQSLNQFVVVQKVQE